MRPFVKVNLCAAFVHFDSIKNSNSISAIELKYKKKIFSYKLQIVGHYPVYQFNMELP
jgi:hypothetical protein